MPPKAQGVGKRIGKFFLHRLFTVIEVTFLIRYLIPYCSMNKALLQFLHAGNKLNRPCRAKQMPYHGFGGVDADAGSLLPEGQLNRPRFKQIVQVGACAVGIDIGNIRKRRACVLHRAFHGP